MKPKKKSAQRLLKRLMKTHSQKLERLSELFNEEHGRWDQTTCDMSCAYEHGYDLWSIYLWSQTGAASFEFEELYSRLPKYFDRVARNVCDEFINAVSSIECECGTYIYQPEYCDGYCSSCGRTQKDWAIKLALGNSSLGKALFGIK